MRRTPAQKARNALIWLLLAIVLLGSGVFILVLQGKAAWGPKLALDLEGGTELLLTPHGDGNQEITKEQLEQAQQTIRQRIDASGVSETEVGLQGGNTIVVSVPGEVDQRTRDLIQASARMEFRPVIATTGNVAAASEADKKLNQDRYKAKGTPDPKNFSDPNWISDAVLQEFNELDCSKPGTTERTIDTTKPVVACGGNGFFSTEKFILGPVEVPGSDIDKAEAGQAMTPTGQRTASWSVRLKFNDEGTKKFHEVTQRLTGLSDPLNRFGILLDGYVISAPRSQAVISDGRPEITGSFTRDAAQTLANQLQYGSLPITFNISSANTISATLGEQQLFFGILSGIIGLIFVAIYSFFQYRLLGLVTVASLGVAGLLTYFAIIWLGWLENYRLSLAGIAGLVVSIGLTADSFIVYFERIRDELREGRGLISAVEHGWERARRTVLASKTVNILAAVVLYIAAVGGVKGFAFTLGLTALADLAVVFLFTHPVLQLLAKTNFFGRGHPASGLDPKRLGTKISYRGAGEVAIPLSSGGRGKKGNRYQKEAQRRMTIAERRREEQQKAREEAFQGASSGAEAGNGEN